MFFNVALYLSSLICIVGIFYKIINWFRLKIGPEASNYTFSQRVGSAAKGICTAVFSLQFFTIIRITILDVVLQARILKGKSNVFRISMHLLIFCGFTLLLFMHALEEQISEIIFSDYASTLNPFLFLRNLFGTMVLAGLAFACFRRKTTKNIKENINANDRYAIIILAIIMISGFFLEGVKIISSSVFDQMVSDYASLEDPEEIKPLKMYWADQYKVVFSNIKVVDIDLLEEGKEMHEESCMDCHSQPQSAFISYQIAKTFKPIAIMLNRIQADIILWYIHVLSCFIGLAYLPFSKFFHLISSSVTLLANANNDESMGISANTITLRAASLDACTHCGTCAVHCSVAPAFQMISNKSILPSEKLIAIKKFTANDNYNNNHLKDLQEGSFICTGCNQCTSICPVGINLLDLWTASKSDLEKNGFQMPYIETRDTCESRWASCLSDHDTPISPENRLTINQLDNFNPPNNFSVCFKCSTCSNVCPVVACYENPEAALGMMPHQIMHSLSLGLGKMIFGTKMIWNCTTCYLCQENCPQGVKITDILYELRGLAHHHERVTN